MLKLFDTPVAAGNYLAGFGTAKGAQIRSIDYDSGQVRFSLVANDDSVSGVVNGITVEDVSEETVAAEIRAVVDATN